MKNLDPSPDAEYDLETQFTHELHDLENEHPWVLDDDKAILILQYSKHPSAEPATFGETGCLKHINSHISKFNIVFSCHSHRFILFSSILLGIEPNPIERA